jgi:uncharacterized protein (TIGR00251 family)
LPVSERKLVIPVRVQTRGSKSAIVGFENGRLRIKTNAPPVDGRANKDVIRQLAAAFGVPPSRVSLKRGARSALKTFVVENPARMPLWAADIDFS